MSESNLKNNPIWPALASIPLTPIVAVILIISAFLMIASWPFMPIAIYAQKKKEARSE